MAAVVSRYKLLDKNEMSRDDFSKLNIQNLNYLIGVFMNS
jgi:hypothetical protein